VLIRPRLRWSQYCRRHNCVGQLVDSPLALPNSVRPWAFPSYQSQTKIRGSERPWNRVGCKSAGPDRYLRPPARRHRLAGVWNSRDRRKVILFSGSAYGNTETTDRLFKSKQRAVRNPAPLQDRHSATDRASGTRERPTSGESGDAEIWRSTFDRRFGSRSPHRSGED